MSDQEVKIRITTDASGAITGFKTVREETEKVGSATSSVVSSIKNNWLKATAAVGVLSMGTMAAIKMIDDGAREMGINTSFKNVAATSGIAADQLIENMKRATKGTIDDSDLMKKAVKLMLQEYNSDQIERFAKNASTSARYMGVSTAEAFDQVADALANKTPKALVLAGAITREQVKLVNAAVEAGASDMALYELAMANLELKALKLAGSQSEATLSIRRFRVQIEETKDEMSMGLVVVLQKAYGGMQWLAAGALTAAASIPYLLAKMQEMQAWVKEKLGGKDEADRIRQLAAETMRTAEEMSAAAQDLTGKAIENITRSAEAEAKGSKAAIDEAQKRVKYQEAALNNTVASKKASDEAAREAERLQKQWEQTKITLEGKVKATGLLDVEQDLIRVETETDKLLKHFEKIGPDASVLIRSASQYDIDEIIKKYEKQGASSYEKLYDDTIRDAYQFYSEIEGYEAKTYEMKIEYIERERDIRKKMYGEAAADAWATQEKIVAGFKRYAEPWKGTLDDVSSTLENISGLYADGSKQQEQYHKAALAFSLAAKGIETAQAVILGVKAVMNAMASGDGYTAVVRGAAVAAMVAAYLSQIGASFSSQGGGASAVVNPVMGNSTALGAEYGTGSESATKSFELLQDTYDLEDTKLTKIYDELRDLNDNISGLVTSILRTGSYDAFDVESGYYASQYQKLLKDSFKGASEVFVTLLQGSFGMLYTPWIAGQDKLSENITEFLSHSYNDIFGGGQEIWSTGSGVALGSTSIRDLLAGSSVSSRAYQDITKRTSTEFWRSDSYDYETIYKELDGDVQRMFDLVYQGLGETLVELANQFGADAAAALNYTFEETKINLADMTGEEMNAALQEYISKIGDEAAESLFGDLIEKYQELNEGLLETATRLVLDKNSILHILDYTNQAFTGTTSELIKFSESLIDVAGSLEDLTDAFDTYYDAFFSDAEKQADREKSLSDAMALYGYTLPGERDDYRDLVEKAGLLDTESGQATYYALLALSKTADAYYDYIEKLKDSIDASDYATYADYQRAIRGYASGGSFAGGWRVVGETGPELEFTGPSRIYSNADSKKLINESNVILIEELRALRVELKQVVRNTKDTASNVKILDEWNEIGMPVTQS